MHKQEKSVNKMAETREMQDALVLNSGVVKGMPGRAQAYSNACFALPTSLQTDQDTLIEQSTILLKQSVNIIDYVKYIVTPAL